MLKERQETAQRMATALFAVEQAIESAITAATALTGLMPAARSEVRLSAVVGQGAFDRSIETIALLGQARARIVDTHHELAGIRDSIGLRTFAFGGLMDKPPALTGAQLNIVETAAA